MREIKFRAWDTKEKKMRNEALFIGNIGLGDGSVLASEEVQTNNPLDWMQYTGIKDKNGKEIYFGDIIRYIDIDTNGKENCIAEVVETMNYGAGILADDCISDLWEDNLVHQFEVIGNIYENQELLSK